MLFISVWNEPIEGSCPSLAARRLLKPMMKGVCACTRSIPSDTELERRVVGEESDAVLRVRLEPDPGIQEDIVLGLVLLFLSRILQVAKMYTLLPLRSSSLLK